MGCGIGVQVRSLLASKRTAEGGPCSWLIIIVRSFEEIAKNRKTKLLNKNVLLGVCFHPKADLHYIADDT